MKNIIIVILLFFPLAIEAQDKLPLLKSGIIAFNEGRLIDAINTMDSVIIIDPEEPSAYFYRGTSKMLLSQENFCNDLIKAYNLNYVDALKILILKCQDEINLINEEIINYYLVEATDRIFDNDFNKAIENLNIVLNLDKNNIEALSKRAFAYKNIGEFKHAIKDYTEVIANDPENLVDNLISRGIIYLEISKPDSAIFDFSEAIGIDKHNPVLYMLFGEAYLDKSDYESAIKYYSICINLYENPYALYKRALARYKSKMYSKEEICSDYVSAKNLGYKDISNELVELSSYCE